jgi:hypothetical protein
MTHTPAAPRVGYLGQHRQQAQRVVPGVFCKASQVADSRVNQ